MLNVDFIATYCERYGFDFVIINQTVLIDGAMFDSIEQASNAIINASNIFCQARPKTVELDEVEELLPETCFHTINLQPLVEDLPLQAVVLVSTTAQDNVVLVTLITPRTRVTCALQVDSLTLQAVLRRGSYELAYEENVLTISYIS